MEKERSKELLVLIDDVFPNTLSSFRNVEFNEYIKNFSDILIINIAKVKVDKKFLTFDKDKTVYFYQTNFKDESIKKIEKVIAKYDIFKASIVFLNNIYAFEGRVLKFLEKHNIPFLFTLYPGGGFFLNDESLKKLKAVLSSKQLYKVIVSQQKIYDYLLENNLCDKNKISYIYGLPTSSHLLNVNTKERRHYGINGKINFNVCFVAFKYSPKGKDKGYDIFIDVSKKLREKYNDIYFHVVGNFDENDIDVSVLDERIAFYGVQSTDWFSKFYKDKDIILSPTRANVLSKGAFDGFPTGASSDAMLNEVLVLTTDPLKLNNHYTNNEDLIIVNHNVEEIVNIIVDLKNNPKKLYKMAQNGYKKANSIYSYENQVVPRLKLLNEMSVEENE